MHLLLLPYAILLPCFLADAARGSRGVVLLIADAKCNTALSNDANISDDHQGFICQGDPKFKTRAFAMENLVAILDVGFPTSTDFNIDIAYSWQIGLPKISIFDTDENPKEPGNGHCLFSKGC